MVCTLDARFQVRGRIDGNFLSGVFGLRVQDVLFFLGGGFGGAVTGGECGHVADILNLGGGAETLLRRLYGQAVGVMFDSQLRMKDYKIRT